MWRKFEFSSFVMQSKQFASSCLRYFDKTVKQIEISDSSSSSREENHHELLSSSTRALYLKSGTDSNVNEDCRVTVFLDGCVCMTVCVCV